MPSGWQVSPHRCAAPRPSRRWRCPATAGMRRGGPRETSSRWRRRWPTALRRCRSNSAADGCPRATTQPIPERQAMFDTTKFYIDGSWVTPTGGERFAVENPATEEQFAEIVLGKAADVDRAARAARRAFAAWSETSREERLGCLHRIVEGFRRRLPELAEMMTREMGAPITFSTQRQATVALFHFEEAMRVLERF